MPTENFADNQIYGRIKITTSKRFTGDITGDVETVKEVLTESLELHEKNAEEEIRLWQIFVNSDDWWEKKKEQRSDINNKVSMATAWMLSRTLNGYIFGEPIKYVARSTEKQEQLETLSSMLDYRCNHNATVMATMSASICGLGYKLALPAPEDDVAISGVPFLINTDIIYPHLAFCVYSDEAIPQKLLGVLIGTYTTEDGEEKEKYTCWTKYAQYAFIEGDDGFELIPQIYGEQELTAYPLVNQQIPLIEVERNPFRKGDWETVVSLIEAQNQLMSGREDDIQQVLDYVLLLTNCKFESDEDKQNAINSRLIELQVQDPNNPPTFEILKNPLDQSGVQAMSEYIDKCIEEYVGIPTRDERGGGGQDTGAAVRYRNGFRDLENNAGLVIPKTEKAELEFISLCIGYAQNVSGSGIGDLKSYDVRLKFMRTLNDDVTVSANAYATLVNAGVDTITALTVSKLVTDPSETAKAIKEAYENGELFLQMQKKLNPDTGETAPADETVSEERTGEDETAVEETEQPAEGQTVDDEEEQSPAK